MSEARIDATRILSGAEIAQVLTDLKRRAKRSVNSRMNLALFRLATCCGLRVSELIGLRLDDVRVGVPRPYLRLRKEITKRHKPRRVPLWWDQGTLDDLTAWRDCRVASGAKPGDPLLCSQSSRSAGHPLDRFNARHRYKVACRVLGMERVREITIHTGRHTFVSHALKVRTLAEARDAAGHASIGTTSLYAHIATDDNGAVGSLFG